MKGDFWWGGFGWREITVGRLLGGEWIAKGRIAEEQRIVSKSEGLDFKKAKEKAWDSASLWAKT
jgi:hypothetical protein